MTDSWKTEPPPPLRPQRGGTPSPEAVRYRDDLVLQLTEQLAAGENIVLTAEKRTGKSAVLTLVRASAPQGMVVILRDVEAVGSPRRLAEVLCEDLRPHLSTTEKAKRFVGQLAKLGGTSLGPITLPEFPEKGWQAAISELFDGVDEHLRDEDLILAMLWDEAPWMIDKVRRECGWQTATDLLDELRAIRARCTNIRFIFTGSIGFHHVLRDLRDGASHRTSINDMRKTELPPLSPTDAGRLAWALLAWTIDNRDCSTAGGVHLADVAGHIGLRCDGIPWFIHAVVDDLSTAGRPFDIDLVDEVIDAAMLSAADGWELRHYLERLDTYYGEDAGLAASVLDTIAVQGSPTPGEILQELAHSGPGVDKSRLRVLLDRLHEDHYLAHRSPAWTFQYDIIRLAWLKLRDLAPAGPRP